MFEMTALGQSWMYQSLPAALVLAGLVTGCAGMGDQSLDDALADPGKHAFYTCGDLDSPSRMAPLDALRIRIDLRKRGTNHVARKARHSSTKLLNLKRTRNQQRDHEWDCLTLESNLNTLIKENIPVPATKHRLYAIALHDVYRATTMFPTGKSRRECASPLLQNNQAASIN